MQIKRKGDKSREKMAGLKAKKQLKRQTVTNENG